MAKPFPALMFAIEMFCENWPTKFLEDSRKFLLSNTTKQVNAHKLEHLKDVFG